MFRAQREGCMACGCNSRLTTVKTSVSYFCDWHRLTAAWKCPDKEWWVDFYNRYLLENVQGFQFIHLISKVQTLTYDYILHKEEELEQLKHSYTVGVVLVWSNSLKYKKRKSMAAEAKSWYAGHVWKVHSPYTISYGHIKFVSLQITI